MWSPAVCLLAHMKVRMPLQKSKLDYYRWSHNLFSLLFSNLCIQNTRKRLTLYIEWKPECHHTSYVCVQRENKRGNMVVSRKMGTAFAPSLLFWLFLWPITKEFLSLKTQRHDLDLNQCGGQGRKERKLLSFILKLDQRLAHVWFLHGAGLSLLPLFPGNLSSFCPESLTKIGTEISQPVALTTSLCIWAFRTLCLKTVRAPWSLTLLLCSPCSAVTDTESDDFFKVISVLCFLPVALNT